MLFAEKTVPKKPMKLLMCALGVASALRGPTTPTTPATRVRAAASDLGGVSSRVGPDFENRNYGTNIALSAVLSAALTFVTTQPLAAPAPVPYVSQGGASSKWARRESQVLSALADQSAAQKQKKAVQQIKVQEPVVYEDMAVADKALGVFIGAAPFGAALLAVFAKAASLVKRVRLKAKFD
mmetsp:Transcript_29644/g.90705  ORF Transcript_29644/g.90705 Transcript_29644/m.90705 type:complete len:182 (+) Transcript_29644:12-557(+)